MTNAAKYVIVIGSLVLLGGIGVYGLRNVQDSTAASAVTPVAISPTPTPKPTATALASPSTSNASADVTTQNAEFSKEAADTPGSVESASPTDEPTPTDTSTTDTVLNNQ